MPFAKGDKFDVENELVVDVENVTLSHGVAQNGKVLVSSKTTWKQLNAEDISTIQKAISDSGLTAGKKSVVGATALLAEWKKLTALLGHLNASLEGIVKAHSLD